MADAAVAAPQNQLLRQVEFYAFCLVSIALKSLLLIGLPYREWPVNTVYTSALLVLFYCYFRFRQGLRAPISVVFCLAAAVAVDVLGNKFGLYGHPFGPLRDYDEFAHFAGSGFSAVGALWVLRAGTRRMGFNLGQGLLSLLATSVAFTYCGWYEILELFDEWFWSGFTRIHWWYDTANDLFYDFIGVIAFIAIAGMLFALRDRMTKTDPGIGTIPVSLKNMFSTLPTDFLAVIVFTVTFGLCCWFEIALMWDQTWFGREHFVGNRDCAIRLLWELAGSMLVGLGYAASSRLKATTAVKPA
jgi:hypothetical protein